MMHRSELLRELKASFPSLAADINRQQGLLHLEIDVMRKRAQRAIYDGDRQSLDVLYHLAVKSYVNGNAALKDAVDVSFVEPLDFAETQKGRYRWVWDCLPALLKQLYLAFHNNVHFESNSYGMSVRKD